MKKHIRFPKAFEGFELSSIDHQFLPYTLAGYRNKFRKSSAFYSQEKFNGITHKDESNIFTSDNMNNEIQTIKDHLLQIIQITEDFKSKPVDKSNEVQEEIATPLEKSELTNKLPVSFHFITAPVILPPPEDIEVRLVPSTHVQHLEVYRSEQTIWTTVTGILVSAILGLIINFLTGSKMSREAWILLSTFILLAVFTFLSSKRFQNHANIIKTQIFKK